MTVQVQTIVVLSTDTLPDLAGKISRWHRSAISLAGESLNYAFQCGQALIEAKARVGHGEWLEWREKNIPGISERQTQNYMRAAKERAAIEAIAGDGPLTIDGALSLIATRRPNPQPTADLKSSNVEQVELMPSLEAERTEPGHDEAPAHWNRIVPIIADPVIRSAKSRLDDHELEPEARTPAQNEREEFYRLRKKLCELVTLLSRTAVFARALDKRIGHGTAFIRTLTAAHDDCERWSRMLREWSDANGGGK